MSNFNNFFSLTKEMDYDDDDDEERMTNGDLSRDLRNDEDDLRDPVDVRILLFSSLCYLNCLTAGTTNIGGEE